MAMTALDRLVGRLADGPARRRPPARLAVPALAAVLVIVSAAVVLLSPGSQQDGGQASDGGQATDLSGAPCPVPAGGTPLPLAPGPPRPQAECDAFAEEFAANQRAAAATPEPSPGVPTPAPRYDFWGEFGGGGDGPAYRSLEDVGARSEAVVLGSLTGEVEPGREACDEGALAAGASRAQACIAFVNLPFRIDELLAGSLPEQYRTIVKIEKQVDPGRQAALREVVPTDERVVLFIGSKYLRRAGIQDVYYDVGAGKGTFREVDGRVVPLALWDPEFGRLEGMPFDQFIDLVRRVPILDLMPEG